MRAIRIAASTLLASFAAASAFAVSSADPLAAVDMNRNAIIADIVQGFDGDRAALAKRLAGLRADRLLSASLASTRESLESILAEAEKSREATVSRAGAKVLGSAGSDLVYTPISPCRLIDTRGNGAPIQGGPFAANERRAYTPNGQCGLPLTGVASMLISFTTLNLTPNSGGYLAIIGPGAPVLTTVDIFNLGSSWSGSNTSVATGPAAQFDVFISTANPEVVIDILGYFAPPQGTVVKSVTAGTGLTGGTITDTGTVALATAYQLPQACTNAQVPQSNGAGVWNCVTPPTPNAGTVTGVTASAPLTSSGGAAPDISLTAGTAGQVLVSAGGPPTWSDSLSLNGNLNLAASTPTSGMIRKQNNPFIHAPGLGNTFVGSIAGDVLVAGFDNTGIGASALNHIASGNANVAVGSFALVANINGSANTASGVGTLSNNTSGSNNIALGASAGSQITAGSDNIAIGHPGGAGENATTRIGFFQTRTFVSGIRGVTTDVANAIPVLIDGSGQLGTVSSSRRFKDDIADMDASSGALMKLRPVTFHYKSDRNPSGRSLQYGLIAEEVAEVYPGLVAHSADGQVETVMYQYLPPMLLNEYQKQQRTIEAQAREIAELRRQSEREIAELRQQAARMALALERLVPVNVVRQ